MVDFGSEVEDWWFKGVVVWEGQMESEVSALDCGVSGISLQQFELLVSG